MFRVPSRWRDCSQRKMEQAEGKCRETVCSEKILDGPGALIQKLLSTNTEFFLAWHSGAEVPELPLL